MSEDNNTVQISIYGQEYSVKAPADAEYIKKVAAYLDEKMIEVQSGFSTTQSSTRIAILAAMNITDELFTAKRDQDSGKGEIDDMITTVNFDETKGDLSMLQTALRGSNQFYKCSAPKVVKAE